MMIHDVPDELGWMASFPVCFPRPRGLWTVTDGRRFAGLEPETGRIRLVDPGNDIRLPALAGALAAGELLSYRIGRRAAVRLPSSFIKVMRPARVADVARRHRALQDLGFGPDILAVHDGGAVQFSPVPGDTLHSHLTGGAALDVLESVAERLAVLHRSWPPPDLVGSKPDPPERSVWLARRVDERFAAVLTATSKGLPALAPGTPALVHGDLHDKNVLIHSRGVDFIDLDGAGIGWAEDDVANLAVHLGLRSLQRGDGVAVANRSVEHFVQAYDRRAEVVKERLRASVLHVWYRLAGLYRFRTSGRVLIPVLLHNAAGSALGQRAGLRSV